MRTTTTSASSRRTSLTLAVILLSGIVLGGCAAPHPDDADAGTSAGSDPRDRLLAVNACLREKGYPVPDEVDDDKGGSAITFPDGVDPDQYAEDFERCAADAPGAPAGAAGDAGGGGTATPLGGPEIGECVRKGGYPDYPDDPEEQQRYRAPGDAAFDDRLEQCIDQFLSSSSASATPIG